MSGKSKFLQFLRDEEFFRVVDGLLAVPSLMFFLLPTENAHDYRHHFCAFTRHVRGADIWILYTDRYGKKTDRVVGQVGLAGFRTKEAAKECLAPCGRRHVYQHYIVDRDTLQSLRDQRQLERIKRKLYA